MTDRPNKLHLGPGKVYLPGFWNVDIFSNVKADEYADMTALPYPKESFDLIYCSHCLEHVHRHMVAATLAHWRDILRPGGILRLAVPNFAAISGWYRDTGDLEAVMGLLYGGQNSHLNRHTTTFDEAYLTKLLAQAGFVDVKWWDWKKTEHAAFDDFASATLPHMQQNNGGRLMSLNLEAVKP